ncbi:TPA: TIGR02391 family protein [Pseudomonas aeruginosa]|uniref:TIGR02391 family protein n=1 Tax=Pseudomonas aeruginosa TaxID=287 RepID=UPI001C2D704E|nr:TIGR02391 family protein [Pseudomonas aeruginosa]MCK1838881.1 TIGR02391 family protein [Pseudomonas aeruginosa]HBN8638009.1 TIGR02391 family protein [Pseudomonas aeruginosa]HBN9350682.1 TIGR02391 family protein [Pseudomonas aeruginosa]HCI2807275.1 TIGR02391 family protein [Pseudomonas aeruginosa]HCI4038879.1 TIGR02391 family protein [Pseudomonas aeruginosa]
MGNRIAPFSSQHLEAVSRVLADTERGLSGSQIGRLLQDTRVPDVDPSNTKWKRLYNALAAIQNQHQVGNHLILFINAAMNPVSYARDRAAFVWRRDELNVVLAFSGFYVRDDGKVGHADRATTLDVARARTGRLKAALENRSVHEEVLKYCRSELLDENYFHAVFEAIKGVAERIRNLTGLSSDGADLVTKAFLGPEPLLVLGSMGTESEKSEQKGFANLLIGLFGAVRNPLAHATKTNWPMSEQDALDIFSMVSLMHRKLDGVQKKERW